MQNMQSAQRMAGVVATTSKTMASVNKQMNPQKVAATMRDFEKANTHMEMSEEMSELCKRLHPFLTRPICSERCT